MDDTSVSGLFAKRLRTDGDSSSMKPYPHRDDYYLFGFISSGRAIVAIDFNEIELSAGDAIIVTPTQVHCPVQTAVHSEGWLLAMSAEHLSPQEATIAAEYSLRPEPIRLYGRSAVETAQLFQMLIRHLEADNVALALGSTIKALILFGIPAKKETGTSRHINLCLRLKELMETNLHKIKNPSSYAEMLNISEVYLNEAVREATGLSVSSFIRNQTALRAKRDLIYTDLSAKEIALRLGYDDYAYFSRLFKKETGISPTRFRRNLK